MKSSHCASMARQLQSRKSELQEQLRLLFEQSEREEQSKAASLQREYDSVMRNLGSHARQRSGNLIGRLCIGWTALLVILWAAIMFCGLIKLKIAGSPVFIISFGDVMLLTVFMVITWFVGNFVICSPIAGAASMFYRGTVKQEAKAQLDAALTQAMKQGEAQRQAHAREIQAQIQAVEASLSVLKNNYVQGYKKYRSLLSSSEYMDKLSALLIREVSRRIASMQQGDTIKLELSVETAKMTLTLIGRVKRERLIEQKYYDVDLRNLPEESAAAALAALLYRRLDLELAGIADGAVMRLAQEQDDGTIVLGICR